MKTIQIGLIGPSRRRQGLGPFIARYAERFGGRVAACVGSSHDSSARGAGELEALLGHEIRPYRDVASMIDGESARGAPLDALVIASPHATHEAAVLAAAAAGLHVLCEKPLIWGGEDLVGRAAGIIDAFARAGRVLQVNAQWPFTLPAYFRLFPALEAVKMDRFHCRFSPISMGAAQIPDALPHPLSLLQALSPSGAEQVQDLRVEILKDGFGSQNFAFTWPGVAGPVSCTVQLEIHENLPRPAEYGIQGHTARRVIRLPEYELSFRGETAQAQACGGPDNGEVDIEDPLGNLVRNFLLLARDGCHGKPDDSLLQRIRMLKQIHDAYQKLSQT